ncbi:ATP-dependent zinc metalloprotease FtsH [Rickettsiales bacterium LUAb2]
MGSRYSVLIFIGISLLGLIVFNFVTSKNFNQASTEITYSAFLDKLNSNQVKSVTMIGNVIDGKDSKGASFKTVYPVNDNTIINNLKEHKVSIDVKRLDGDSGGYGFATWIYILIFIGIIWFIFSRNNKNSQSGGAAGGSGPFSFGRSKAKMISPKDGKVTFEDVAGVKEAKDELAEVVEFLKYPDKFKKLGAKIPKGCLLVGSPGTGKTLLAKAVAGEASVPFFVISGSDFVEMFVGVGASRVRDLFEQAKKQAPCIIFIDEIDAVGRQRGAGLGGGNDEREQTLNQLLVEMDGFGANQGIIVMAATNRPDVLDPALLRPGRFDRQITVPYPDIIGREQILRVHMKKVPIATSVNVTTIARGSTGFSGADLANLVNEAALFAAKKDRTEVIMEDFEQARDKIIMGSERRSMQLTEDERKLTAYHEAGHTLIALNVKNYHPLHKVTIIPRGRALGVTAVLPEKDQLNYSEKQLKDQIAVLYGGRITEELIYGKDSVTTGASNDIQVATNLARRMVTEWGYSDKLGKIRYESSESEVFLGHSVTQKKNISEKTAEMIDAEVKNIIEEGEKRAREILTSKKDDLEKITQALLKYETLNGDEVAEILKGNSIIKDEAVSSFKNQPTESETSVPVL